MVEKLAQARRRTLGTLKEALPHQAGSRRHIASLHDRIWNSDCCNYARHVGLENPIVPDDHVPGRNHFASNLASSAKSTVSRYRWGRCRGAHEVAIRDNGASFERSTDGSIQCETFSRGAGAGALRSE